MSESGNEQKQMLEKMSNNNHHYRLSLKAAAEKWREQHAASDERRAKWARAHVCVWKKR